MKKILLDMDGVIADFVAGAALLHGRDPATADCWDFPDKWGIAAKDFWAPMGWSFWAALPKTPEADAVVFLCEAAVGSENVCLLSSPCDTDGCIEGKLDWIKKHYPQFSRRFLFGPAKEFCAGRGRLLVDDSDKNIIDFFEAGGCACRFPRPWNAARGADPITRLKERLELFTG